MANHKSAIKRHRQSEKRRARNASVKSTLKTAVKRVKDAVKSANAEEAQANLKTAESLLDSAVTKGVLISPTVYGNVMLGPTAEDLPDKAETGTSEKGLKYLWEKGEAILPALMREEVTALYAGLRAATEHSDYQIRLHKDQRYLCVGGIRSTGVSGSIGIAEYVVELLAEAGLPLTPKAEFKPVRMPYIGEAEIRPYQSAGMIAANPAYGQIVCHCERVTLGEILDAAHAVIPARTVDGLRRRTRVLQGRCQGFNCHAEVVSLLSRETGQSPARLTMLEAANGA